MSFISINKVFFFIFLLLIFSCQNNLSSLNDNNTINKTATKFEKNEKIDFSINKILDDNIIDYYSNQSVNYNFLEKKLHKIKINNFEGKIENNISLNIVFNDSSIYSVNFKGNILKFDIKTGKLIDRINIALPYQNTIPVSFSLIDNDFIIGFKSGEIIRVNNEGIILWEYVEQNLLNTPIKYYDNSLIALYPEDIVILSPNNGEILFKKNFNFNNIIQSSGGKIVNYFNLIFFILPNSTFNVIDTFLYEDHRTNLDEIEVNNLLNNLDDHIHIYKNLFVYLDNGNSLYSYDLIKNQYLLSNYRINKITSSILFNNSLITKNNEYIKFYNLKNGNLFSEIKIDKLLKKDSKLIYATTINKKLHLFTNEGKLLILNNQLEIENNLDLKIRKINKVYNYQGRIFISTNSGITYIY